ncbi:MAG: type II toxin-antitoxin system RelE/ParE family toxin [Gammaproteobacteria bacterium]|nr:type II toxin-antitoxin system RelE/ParE family toxin [Gammaproteobacteria bacterium]
MSFPIKYSSRAQQDVRQALAWYKKQRKGLEADFLNCLEDTIARIQQHPELYPKPYKMKLQRALLRRFPFSVYYRVENEIIYIFAVFDNRQNPEKLIH